MKRYLFFLDEKKSNIEGLLCIQAGFSFVNGIPIISIFKLITSRVYLGSFIIFLLCLIVLKIRYFIITYFATISMYPICIGANFASLYLVAVLSSHYYEVFMMNKMAKSGYKVIFDVLAKNKEDAMQKFANHVEQNV